MSSPSGLIQVCESHQLQEGGAGIRFEMQMDDGQKLPCFVVRYQGQAHAYINQCQHLPVELDWKHGQFFDKQSVFLICATHGALYMPDTGYCVDGPCAGKYLHKLNLIEQDQKIFIQIQTNGETA